MTAFIFKFLAQTPHLLGSHLMRLCLMRTDGIFVFRILWVNVRQQVVVSQKNPERKIIELSFSLSFSFLTVVIMGPAH